MQKPSRSYRTYLLLGKLQPWFLRFQRKTCPWEELSDDDILILNMDFKVNKLFWSYIFLITQIFLICLFKNQYGHFIIRVFCPRACPLLQTQEPRPQRSSVQRQISTANSGIQAAVLLGMDRCGSFPLLSAPQSLFSI